MNVHVDADGDIHSLQNLLQISLNYIEAWPAIEERPPRVMYLWRTVNGHLARVDAAGKEQCNCRLIEQRPVGCNRGFIFAVELVRQLAQATGKIRDRVFRK